MTKSIISGLFVLFLFQLHLYAQKPEKIYSFVKVSKPLSYYQEQAELWKKEINKNKKNAAAWQNYYQAERNIHAKMNNNSIPYATYYTKIDSIVKQMAKYVPNSFEYNYVKWYQGGNDLSLFPYLEKAYKLAPERSETYEDFVIYYEVKRDTAKRNFFARKMYNSEEASPGLLNYNYNVLQGLDKDAILLAGGDNDTYPVWMLQQANGVRKDVTLLNLSLLLIDEYRNKLFDELGIKRMKMDSELTQDVIDHFSEKVIKHIAANSKKPVYIALSACENYPASFKDSLYLTGLALKYSPEKIDNIAILQKNFEQNYALDYLKVNFSKDRAEGIVKETNANYLVPLLNLYEHYKESGENGKADNIKALAMSIGEAAGQEEDLKKYFEKN